MIRWYKRQTTTAKAMVVIIILLLIGIIIRREYIADRVSTAFKERFAPAGDSTNTHPQGQPADTLQ